MLNFTIHTTTEIIFGRGIEEQIGPKLKEIGAHRVLVHFGGSSARSSGLLDRFARPVSRAHGHRPAARDCARFAALDAG